MDTVAEHCDRVAVFAQGEIIKVGTPKEIFSDLEKMRSQGLLLPVTAQITGVLKQNGIDCDNDFTIDGFVNAVAKKLGGKG